MMALHFLRPWWFLMLIPLSVMAWYYWTGKVGSRDWRDVIDARLLPYLLVGQQTQKKRWPILLGVLVGVLAVTALAGPVWKRLPQPVFKQQSALVILFDLSQSMNAQDIKPSRIARARLKLIDLLKQRKEGQTALIAYAATAYTVTPLTDDVDTIASLSSSLKPEIMPAQGSRPDRAIKRALELFENATVMQGDILLITDGISGTDKMRIDALALKNFRLSVLAVGSAEGAPIPLPQGGFIKDASGSIVIAKSDFALMKSLADEHGGIYSPLTVDDGDIEKIQKMIAATQWRGGQKKLDFSSDRFQEEGPWLLLLILPLVALAFRRGVLMTLLVAFMLLPVTRPLQARTLEQWQDWFKNDDQKAQQLLQQGEALRAAEKFRRPDWKAAALYKAGEYEQALQQLEKVPSVEAKYNRANALAKLGRLQDALKVYDEVLQKNPQHEDAAYNRKLVEQALKKQQQDQKGQDQKSQDQQSQAQQSQDQQSQAQQSQDQKSQDQKSQDQKSQDQQSQDQQKKDDAAQSQQAREDQLKQQQEKQAQQDKTLQQKPQSARDEKNEAKKQLQKKPQAEPTAEDMKQRLDKQAEEQWLRRIPDDPGGLLRNKFRYQYSRQQPPVQEKEPW